jgi:hypothetical protein
MAGLDSDGQPREFRFIFDRMIKASSGSKRHFGATHRFKKSGFFITFAVRLFVAVFLFLRRKVLKSTIN